MLRRPPAPLSTRVCSEMGDSPEEVWRGGRGVGFGSDDQDRQDSGLSPDLCDRIVRRVLLHLREPDALVELL